MRSPGTGRVGGTHHARFRGNEVTESVEPVDVRLEIRRLLHVLIRGHLKRSKVKVKVSHATHAYSNDTHTDAGYISNAYIIYKR